MYGDAYLASLEKMWRQEVEAAATYRLLSGREPDPRRKDILVRLAVAEEHHAQRWAERIEARPDTALSPEP